jgi:hypothetical protein
VLILLDGIFFVEPPAITNNISNVKRQLGEGKQKESGAGGRTRTDMSLTSPDFESGAYTNFATPASWRKIISRVIAESQPEALMSVPPCDSRYDM